MPLLLRQAQLLMASRACETITTQVIMEHLLFIQVPILTSKLCAIMELRARKFIS